MRFTNVLVALGSVASVVSAFQGVNDDRNLDITDDNAYHDAATTLLPVPLDARANKKGDNKGGKKTDTTSTKGGKKTVTTSTKGAKKGGKKTDTTSTKGDKKGGKTTDTTSADACSIKRSPRLRFMPRADGKLDSSPSKPGSDGSYNLLEHQWVTAATLKSGDKVAVSDVTGCSAIFLWNKDNIPSVFHIFCERGAADAPTMASEVGELGSKTKPVFVTIAARDEKEASVIRTAIMQEFGKEESCDPQGLEEAKDFDIQVYNNEVPAGRLATEAYRFDAVAGIRKVTKSKEPKVSKQASRSISSYF